MSMLETDAMTKEQIRRRLAELGPWFHNLELGGVNTAPDHFLGDYPSVKWQRFAGSIPADLRGRSVLDVGCNAGFYSIQMKQRGADRVVAIDSDEKYLEQARFAAKVSGAEIEFHKLSVYRVGDLAEKFDVVFFMGVLYANDPTNWWVPNCACFEAMLRSAGFEILDHPDDQVFICRRVEVTGPLNYANELREITS